jgi:hypothetical protein
MIDDAEDYCNRVFEEVGPGKPGPAVNRTYNWTNTTTV